LTSIATTRPSRSRHSRSIGPIAVGYSRRTRVRPSSIVCGAAGEQFLQMRLDAVLLQTGIVAERRLHVGQDLVHRDGQRLALRVGDDPGVVTDHEHVRCVHPVERFVRTTVGVDRHAAVGLHHDEADRLGRWAVSRPA
jgi:hypothetical protein